MAKKINIIVNVDVNETYNNSKLLEGKNLNNVNEKLDNIKNISNEKICNKRFAYLQKPEKIEDEDYTKIDVRGLTGVENINSNKTNYISHSKSNYIVVKEKNRNE